MRAMVDEDSRQIAELFYERQRRSMWTRSLMRWTMRDLHPCGGAMSRCSAEIRVTHVCLASLKWPSELGCREKLVSELGTWL
jgi:hypothetical protein